MPGLADRLPLTPEDCDYLQRVAASRTEEARRVLRAKLFLGVAAGEPPAALAERLDVSIPTVYRCVDKACAVGIRAALDDIPRPGRPHTITPEARAWILAVACEKPTQFGYAQEVWTERLLAAHIRQEAEAQGHPSVARISPGTVSKILAAADVHPHKVRYYCERRDPDFDRKMVHVLHVYQQVEWDFEAGHTAPAVARVSYDEKPGIQAIGRTSPDRPPAAGAYSTWQRDYEYVRYGTVSLLAGIDLLTGEVIGLVRDRHRSAEFIEFLQALDAKYPPDVKIQIVLDNHSAHTSKETRQFLASKPHRFELVFTPVHASWLNLIESFFAKMTHQFLRHLRVSSVTELRQRIEHYLAEINAHPVRFRWRKFQLLEEHDNVI